MNGRTPENTATGRIVVDTSDLSRLEATTRRVGTNVSRNLGQINTAARGVGGTLGNLATGLNNVAGAFGVSLGAATVMQLGRAAVAASETATAYNRQEVAARSLAGGQERLNVLLEAYHAATGGAVSQTAALADVTRLQAVGFADSADELTRFVRVARGISLAMGSNQEYVISQLQLAIANQSTMRLDQLGLGVAEVTQRIEELRAANRGLTKEAAYQEAILGAAEEKFGDVTEAAGKQTTGVENLRSAWADAGLVMGQALSGPVNFGANLIAGMLPTGRLRYNSADQITPIIDGLRTARDRLLQDLADGVRPADEVAAALIEVEGKLRSLGRELDRLTARPDRGKWADEMGGAAVLPATGPTYTDEQQNLMVAWSTARTAIERDTNRQIEEVTREYGQRRVDLIADYERTIARDAADFARQRAREAEDYAREVADLQADAAQREAELAADQADRVEKLRGDAAERLADLEEKYQRQRERAAADHRERIADAAARLDAVGLYEEQRRYAREQADAAQAHQEQKDALDESLADQLAEAGDAYEKQLEQQRQAAAERLADLDADRQLRLDREDEDRSIRLARLAADHQAQLDEMDTQHGLRLTQIQQHAAAERTQLDDEFSKQLAKYDLESETWKRRQEARQDEALKLFEAWWDKMNLIIDASWQPAPKPDAPKTSVDGLTPYADGGPVARTGPALVHAGEYVLDASTTSSLRGLMGAFDPPALLTAVAGGGTTRSVTVAPGAIAVYGAPGMDESRVAALVEQRLVALLEAVA